MSSNLFQSHCNKLSDQQHQYQLFTYGELLCYAKVLDLWQYSVDFRNCFIQLLQNSAFSNYRFETPPITEQTVNQPFEFVLIDSPWLTNNPDQQSFSQYLTSPEPVVTFNNLGNDALLLVPTPTTSPSAYAHIGAFMRKAPTSQIHALWQQVGQNVQQQLSALPLWVSTAGGGVAWLHIRLDCEPKYYSHQAYKVASSFDV